ncbi:MAG: 16S rRNA (guanine(966)-N(2))-methyltransferase RsmD [Chloroflexota bacterium]|nr:MAG: 16S rRNA (guanine(966)-N(2))-methyltransferase RsmD [Chloroflexota bacterium]
MRVISGSAKGRKLRSVPGESTRPITDRVKEALFNIIGPDIQESAFLDMFAGTGSVGIEALSRGAKTALFIDLQRVAVKTVNENLKLTKLTDGAEVVRGDALAILDGPPHLQYDYVYIAPPQYQGIWIEALRKVDDHLEWLSEDAWVIIQIHPQEIEDQKLNHLVEFDRRNYGSTVLIFYQVRDE